MNILGATFAALLNSLWQSAVIALLVWAALRFLPSVNIRINAATRCAVWWAVLAAVVFLPLAPQQKNVQFEAPVASYESASIPVTIAPVALPPLEIPPASSRSVQPLHITAGAGLLAIFAIWSVLSLFRIAQIIRSYRYLRRVKKRSRSVSPERMVNFNYWLLACGVDRTARLLVSSEIASPMAVGFRRPAVIVPETLLNEFTPEELDHVLLHELAHIARYDDWTNLFARLIGALLPVHPVAVWLIKNIEQEREVACDDWVVAMTGEARPYAASLTRLFELCSARRRQLLATGMADRASHLGERIEALLRSGRDFAPRVSLVRVALGAVVLVGLVFAGAQAPHWVAFAQEPAVPPRLPVAPVPAVPPVPPLPVVTPQSPQARQEPIAAPDSRGFQRDIGALLEEVNNQIRIADAQISAQQMQVRAQNEQQRAVEQGPASAPNGSFLAALVSAGYGNLSVDEIIEIRNSGVSPEFLRAVSDSGLKPSAKELVELARSGVSGQYLRALRDDGFKNLGIQDIVEAARSGVRPDLIRALKDSFPQITMREIVDAAHTGLNPNDLRQAREYSPNLTLEQVIRLKKAGVI